MKPPEWTMKEKFGNTLASSREPVTPPGPQGSVRETSHLPHHPNPASRKAHGNGLLLARIIGPPLPRLSPKRSQNLPSPQKKPTASAFVAVKGKFLDIPGEYRHSVLEQSTIITLEGSDWTSESDVTLLHIAATVRHAYLVYSS
ncbi:hypothetical protein AVEN_214739-1 [Araneus ventricosus]|uniref:Uncharacterized protein n=1 Tax=Araneus ventricosus TaxID=182803 RepID=A0A4Y2IF93_ARAVE|nr:hypothetical protein AVEN_214739-1 [Araneus ventricosus]